MSDCRDEDNAPRDAGDEALDALMAGADADLQDVLGAALNVDAGLTDIIEETPSPPGRYFNDFIDVFEFGALPSFEYVSPMRLPCLVEAETDDVLSAEGLCAPPVSGDEGGG